MPKINSSGAKDGGRINHKSDPADRKADLKVTNRKRDPKYTPQEKEALVNLVNENKKILFGPFTSTLTSAIKCVKWAQITKRINKIGNHQRDVRKIQKKWSDLQSRTKIKYTKLSSKLKKAQAKTGRNKPLDVLSQLPPLEQRIIDVMGETAVQGIDDGVDTLSASDENGPQTEEVTASEFENGEEENMNNDGFNKEENSNDVMDVEVLAQAAGDIADDTGGKEKCMKYQTISDTEDTEEDYFNGIDHKIPKMIKPKERRETEKRREDRFNSSDEDVPENNVKQKNYKQKKHTKKTEPGLRESYGSTQSMQLVDIERKKLSVMKEQLLVSREISTSLQMIAGSLASRPLQPIEPSRHPPNIQLSKDSQSLPPMGEAFKTLIEGGKTYMEL